MKKPMQTLFLIALILLSGATQLLAQTEALSLPHPDDPSKKVEYFLDKPAHAGPWPTVIFLHGHQESSRPGGKVYLDWGVLRRFARLGFLAVAVSQPGYGNSTGPPDFCGAFTQQAVLAVIEKLRTDRHVAPNKLVIQGVSRGALLAGLLAARDTSVTGLVLISGVYDLPQYVADSTSGRARRRVIHSLLAETGGKKEALLARSLLAFPEKIKAATLILNGEKDDVTDPDQARRLADAIVSHGGKARAVIYPDYGHRIPVAVRNREIDPFIQKCLEE